MTREQLIECMARGAFLDNHPSENWAMVGSFTRELYTRNANAAYNGLTAAGMVIVPRDDFKRMWESMELDDNIKWCETCGAWLTEKEAATTDDYTGCWKIATGGKHDAENCKSYRAMTEAANAG